MQANKDLIGKVIIAIAIIIGSFIIGEAIIEAAGIIGSQIASAIAIANDEPTGGNGSNQEESKQERTTRNIAKSLFEESRFWLVPYDDNAEVRQVTLNEIKEEYLNKTITMLQVDLDNDGIDEVILQFGEEGDRYIFHDLDGEVYAYDVPYRSMIGITVDKLISGSSSSRVGAFYKVVGFTRTGIMSEVLFGSDELSLSESYYYKVNGEKKEQISGEEYRELLATYTQAGKLIFKEFREENVVY